MNKKFSAGDYTENPALIDEADLIIVHPRFVHLVVELKEGQYHYFNNRCQKQLMQFVGRGACQLT